MKRHILLALLIGTAFGPSAFAQQDILDRLGNRLEQRGRQILEQEFGRFPGSQQQQPKQEVQGYGGARLPSESGQNSGGGGRQFIGDNGFMLTDPNYGQPSMGRPSYGQPSYGQPSFGQPSYGQPAHGHGSYDDYGNPIMGNANRPVISGSAPSSPVSSDQYILIRCPKTASGSVRYTLSSNQGSFVFTMSGGQEQWFQVGSGWIIAYNEGSQERRYRLEGGRSYTIKRNSESHWQLTAKPLAK